MKNVTREEAENILFAIGHHANVTIPVSIPENEQCTDEKGNWIKEDYKPILNNCIVYNPFGVKSLGGSNNHDNAKRAMRFVKDRFRIYSSVFSSYTGDYLIVD